MTRHCFRAPPPGGAARATATPIGRTGAEFRNGLTARAASRIDLTLAQPHLAARFNCIWHLEHMDNRQDNTMKRFLHARIPLGRLKATYAPFFHLSPFTLQTQRECNQELFMNTKLEI